MNRRTKWFAYTDLAWTDHIIAPPDEYAKETEPLINAIKEPSVNEVKTLLHLGYGAGGNDYILKRYYQLTGIDISEKMLEIARDLNPEAVYNHGDMRTIELGELFDAVVALESIHYMRTQNDLYCSMVTAQKHLN
jgi:trans-aconitate methyltransferase